jgi:glycosyltransferase involved in cell wall biosynthesis
MRTEYARAHATIVCFELGIGKAIPNFVLEGLAAGRPSLSVFESGLAADLERSGAGLTASRDVAALSLCVDRLKADWQGYSVRARQLAVDRFSLEAFRSTYERLYREIAAEAHHPS